VEAKIREAGGDLLDAVQLFDVYRGDQVGEGRKSLALRMEFRSASRTLTDEDVAHARQGIEAALRDIGGALRA
jgi:phenylalanyl-tRNA synthetase beta chain